MKDLISIIIPNYNKGVFVAHSLDSLLTQTCRNWEAIIVDDCSTDDSWNIIQGYVKKNAHFSAVRNEMNKGGCYSRNRGAKMAKGEYLIFLDSDDWLANDCLENRLAECTNPDNASVDMLIFPMGTIQGGKQTGVWHCRYKERAEIGFLRHDLSSCWQTMMPIWSRTAFERIGGFDESFPRLQDVELHTRALLMGLKYAVSNRKFPDCFYFVEDTRMTTNYERFAIRICDSMIAYVTKMRRLTSDRHYRNAMLETLFAGVRNIGDFAQSGKIPATIADRLCKKILKCGDSIWLDVYCRLYRLGVNKIHGFNYLYRIIYRSMAR